MCFDENNKCDTSNNILWFYAQISVCDYDLIDCKIGEVKRTDKIIDTITQIKLYMNPVMLICQR